MSTSKNPLEKERENIDFDRAELEVIMQQSPELHKVHKTFQRIMEEDSLLRIGLDIYGLNKEEKIEQGFRRSARLSAQIRKNFGRPMSYEFVNVPSRYFNISV